MQAGSLNELRFSRLLQQVNVGLGHEVLPHVVQMHRHGLRADE